MKNISFALIIFCLIGTQLNAQYCGGSGPSACTVGGALSQPGLSPLSQDLPPIYVDSTVNVTIQFQNYDTTTFAGTTVTIDSLKIDQINNLPNGLCWKTNKPNNQFANRENGCINVSGTVNSADACGQYQLQIQVDAWVHGIGDLTLNAAQEGLFYYVRLKCNPSDTCPRLVDTTGEAAGTIDSIIVYGSACDTGSGYLMSVHELNGISYLSTLSIIPNPLSNEATILFNSTQTGKITETITSIIGSEVYRNELQLALGENKHVIHKGNLPAGVYIYSLIDGQAVYSKKLVISE